jgi:methylated-DNA-[protein]-cysteine S-methyltransferase
MTLLERTETAYVQSPIGTLELTGTERGILSVLFLDEVKTGPEPELPVMKQAVHELSEYFAGKRKTFTVPFWTAGTEFYTKVWEDIGKIPYGKTKQYGQIAETIGSPSAVRAVGTATGRNRLPILIPCHRVFSSTETVEKIGNFACGAWRKQWLLRHEGVK